MCVNDHSPNQILKIHGHKNLKMARWALLGQVGEKPDLFRGRDLGVLRPRLQAYTVTLDYSRLCFGLAGFREPREGGCAGHPLWAHWGLSEGLGPEVSVLELPPLEECPGLGCKSSEETMT